MKSIPTFLYEGVRKGNGFLKVVVKRTPAASLVRISCNEYYNFDVDFMFQLMKSEFEMLMSKKSISKRKGKEQYFYDYGNTISIVTFIKNYGFHKM